MLYLVLCECSENGAALGCPRDFSRSPRQSLLNSPILGFTKPFVMPRFSAATVSPLTTRRMVNSDDKVCVTKGRSRSRTYGRRVEDVGIPWSLGGTSLHSEILLPEPASPIPPAMLVGDGSLEPLRPGSRHSCPPPHPRVPSQPRLGVRAGIVCNKHLVYGAERSPAVPSGALRTFEP